MVISCRAPGITPKGVLRTRQPPVWRGVALVPAGHFPAGVNLTLVPFGEPALLEERVRGAAAFCGLVRGRAPGHVADQLAPVGEALTGVADSLAGHLGEWGAVSRFSTPSVPSTAKSAKEGVTSMPPISFEENVKTLFRPKDRQAMQFAFDLWSYDDVAANADAILARVRAGTMPCDGSWSTEQVDAFQGWVDAGKPR